jgi:hypothetical protein
MQTNWTSNNKVIILSVSFGSLWPSFHKTQPENCLMSLKEQIALSRHAIFEYWINSDYKKKE